MENADPWEGNSGLQRILDIFGLHFDVIGWRMMFAGIVSTIELAFCPEKSEKLLCVMTF